MVQDLRSRDAGSTPSCFSAALDEALGSKAPLRRVLASAAEWGVIDAVPHLPRVKVAESKFDFFTAEESAALVAHARDAEEPARAARVL